MVTYTRAFLRSMGKSFRAPPLVLVVMTGTGSPTPIPSGVRGTDIGLDLFPDVYMVKSFTSIKLIKYIYYKSVLLWGLKCKLHDDKQALSSASKPLNNPQFHALTKYSNLNRFAYVLPISNLKRALLHYMSIFKI